MINKSMFTNYSNDWETPDWLFNQLNEEFGFDIDVCANEDNYKLKNYFSKQDDCLKQDWKGMTCWMNPPYTSKLQDLFFKKAVEESRKGATVVCLLPSRTDTKRFHKYVWDRNTNKPYNNVEIRFLQGRLKFSNSKNSAPFPSMIVIFKKNEINTPRLF
jgi:site-specific DNA-methyltransferase (adenine-specific)